MEITVGPKNIALLFQGQQQIAVPSFQRGYAWGKVQVDDFLDDIESTILENEPHFYGPVVFLKSTKANHPVDVIDGQQRLTTVVTFISILRDFSAKLENKTYGGIVDLNNVIRNSLFLPPLFAKPRFSANYQILDFINKYIVADPVTGGAQRPKFGASGGGLTPSMKKATKEYRAAYFRIIDWVQAKLEGQSEPVQKEFLYNAWQAATEMFEIHSIELYDEDQAFVLFETMNDRGLQLNPSDLLKTLTLREIKSNGTEHEFQLALKKWDQMVETLGDFDFSKFLRHYLLLQQDGKVQSNKIFKIFKGMLSEGGKFAASENLDKLNFSANFYAQLLGEQIHHVPEVTECFARLDEFSETHRVVLLSVLRKHGGNANPIRLCRSIEGLAFRWILTGSNAQQIEDFYQLLARKYESGEIDDDGFIEMVKAFQPSDSEVRAALAISESRPLQKYVLKRLEQRFSGSIPDKATLEHLAPQNPPDGDSYWHSIVELPEKVDEDGSRVIYDQYVTMWGNLTLLSAGLNSSIQNSSWPRKRDGDPGMKYEGISSSNFAINKKLKTLEIWNQAMILNRNEWIADAVIKMVGDQWVKTGNFDAAPWTF